MSDPVKKIYITSDPIENLPMFMFLLLHTQVIFAFVIPKPIVTIIQLGQKTQLLDEEKEG